MITKLTHVTIIVRDQDEALHWYTQKLGFEKRTDAVFGSGFRWLTVAPKDQKDLEIVLQKPDPLLHGRFADQLLKCVGQGTMWVLETDDCRKTHQELRERGVKFVRQPEELPWGISAVFEDLYGNSFNLLERRQASGRGASSPR